MIRSNGTAARGLRSSVTGSVLETSRCVLVQELGAEIFCCKNNDGILFLLRCCNKNPAIIITINFTGQYHHKQKSTLCCCYYHNKRRLCDYDRKWCQCCDRMQDETIQSPMSCWHSLFQAIWMIPNLNFSLIHQSINQQSVNLLNQSIKFSRIFFQEEMWCV